VSLGELVKGFKYVLRRHLTYWPRVDSPGTEAEGVVLSEPFDELLSEVVRLEPGRTTEKLQGVGLTGSLNNADLEGFIRERCGVLVYILTSSLIPDSAQVAPF
jgi:hypothetical protein